MTPHNDAEEIATRLYGLQQDSPLLISLFDNHDRLRYANTAFCECYQVHPHERISWSQMMLRNFRQQRGALIRTDDIDAWLASARSRRGKQPFRAFEADVTDGRWIWMTETVQPDGWMLCIGSDITNLRASERELRQARDLAERASLTDTLTGVSNRLHVMRQLETLLARPRRLQSPGALAILDLDHFKQINDRLGHLAGDKVLRDFALRVPPLLKPHDGFGRMGGEEFLLLLPDREQEETALTVQAMLAVTESARPLLDLPTFSYTCSAGVTLLRPDDNTSTVLSRADEALYLAKAGGRNRFVIL